MADTASSTLVQLLRRRAIEQPDDTAFVFLQSGETESDRLTFATLDARARAIAAELPRRGSGGRATLPYPPGLDFVSALSGRLYAGVAAVPAQVPGVNRRSERLATIVADAEARTILTTSTQFVKMSAALDRKFAGAPLLTDALPVESAASWEEPPGVEGESLALLQ